MAYCTKDTITDSSNQYFVGDDVLGYSNNKSEIAMSPEPIFNSTQIKKQNWNKNKQVENLLLRMYGNEDSSLYHGFLNEHKVQFSLQISLLLKSGARCEQTEPFFNVLESDSVILDKNQTDQYLLDPYHNFANKNDTFGNFPEKGKYPPNRGEKIPPRFNKWEGRRSRNSDPVTGGGPNGGRTLDDQRTDILSSFFQTLSGGNNQILNNVSTTNHNGATVANQSSSSSEVQKVITMKCKWDSIPFSIPIDGIDLKEDSTMMEILCHNDDGEDSFDNEYELNLEFCIGKEYLFQVKVKNGNDNFIFRMKRFLKMSVNDILKLKNVKTPISITVLKRNE